MIVMQRKLFVLKELVASVTRFTVGNVNRDGSKCALPGEVLWAWIKYGNIRTTTLIRCDQTMGAGGNKSL